MSRRTLARRESAAPGLSEPPAPQRMAIGRVRLRSVARVGFSIGWLISFLPALLISALAAWILRGIWGTLDGWTPWTPWAPNTRVGPVSLPAPPEFRPREALHVEGLYAMLAPIGHHPFLGGLLGTIALTALGGGLVALTMILAGAGYNLFARVTGGIEFEMSPRPARRPRATPRPTREPNERRRRTGDPDDDWLFEDEPDLRW